MLYTVPSLQEAEVFVEDVEKHIAGAHREHGVCFPDRHEFKCLPGTGQHKHRNHLIIRAEEDLQIWAVFAACSTSSASMASFILNSREKTLSSVITSTSA